MNTVWIKPRFCGIPLHSMYYEFLKNPPSDYEIIIDKSEQVSKYSNFSSKTQNEIVNSLKYNFLSIPYILYQINQNFNSPKKTDLIFAAEHVISSKKPWIVGLEFAGSLSGYFNPSLTKSIISKKLKDKQCKFILPYSEWGKNTITKIFPNPEIIEKIKIIRYTVSPKEYERIYDDSDLKLLFVGTINPGNLMDYEFKGLNQIIDAFNILQKKYPSLELTIRSKVSLKIKNIIQKSNKIKLIDSFISQSEMNDLYKNSDMFLQAGYGTLTNSVLEAASYGLPIITLDLFNNSEFISHNKNGLLIKIDNDDDFYDKYRMPNEHSSKFIKSIRSHHNEVTKKMIEMVELLIESKKLRKNLGSSAKNSILTGEFSEKHRKTMLKKIFDESIDK